MKLTKRLVAVVLALLMIFSTVSVSAFAWDAKTDGGVNLGIETKILRDVNGTWTPTEKVEKGETVKVQVYLSTDYFAGSGLFMLYYDNAFFEPTVGNTVQNLTMGSYYGTGSAYGITGRYWAGAGSDAESFSNDLIAEGLIGTDYTANHSPILIKYEYAAKTFNKKFLADKVFCEFPLKVKDDAVYTASEESASVEVLESITCNTTDAQYGGINIPKGQETEYTNTATDMWNWDATLAYTSNTVELYNNLVATTFDANGGNFGIGVTDFYSEGEAGEAISGLVTPARDGYLFKGWKVAGADDATATALTVYPDADTQYVAVWEQTFSEGNNITFKTEIYRFDEEAGDWVATDKVKPGETVKARVFIDTDFPAGGANLLAFYNSDFFEDSFSSTPVALTLNPSATGPVAQYNLTGTYFKLAPTNSVLTDLIKNGFLTQEYVNNNPAVSFTLGFPAGADCQEISGEEWICEFELKVKKNAVDTGDFLFVDSTIADPDAGYKAFVTVQKQKSETDTLASNASPMTTWLANPTIESHPVSINNTITLNANGGEFDVEITETQPDKVNYVIDEVVGEKVDYSGVPAISRPGFTFMGWVDASIAEPTIDDVTVLPETMPHYSDANADTKIVYNAFWVSEVDVTFAILNPETETSDAIETITVTAGDPFIAPEDPAIEGYSFVGWTKQVEFKDDGSVVIGNIAGLDAVYPTEDTTYYAIFTSKDYAVTYQVQNPETQKFEVVAVQDTEYGTAISPIPSTYKVPHGYTLSPAYEDVGFNTVLAEGATMPATDLILYYRLIKGEYDAIFNANEGAFADGETTKTVSTVYEAQIVAPEDPVREGYTFNGWQPSVGIMDPNEQIEGAWVMTFEATWAPIKYNAIFYVDGTVFDNYPVEYEAEFEYPADPYKEGYTFLGWAEEADSDVIATLPATMPATDVDYYAVFDANEYTLTFEDTGDSTIAPITQDYGTEIVAPADPELEGYTFKGWALTQGAKEEDAVELPATMPAEDETYYAIWAINTYKVTWVVDGAETEEEYVYGTAITEYTNVDKTGYEFKGWTPEFIEGTTMPANDLTYTAVYEAKPYDAIFNAIEENATYEAGWDDGESTKTVETKFNDEIVAPADPARTGYTFAGWNPAVGTMDTEGKVYYANWTPNADTKYTVEFYSMNTDGTYNETADSTSELTGESDSVIKLAVAAPTGFYLDTDASTYDDNLTIAPNGSTVVTVYYARNLYTITFNGNEGTVNDQASVTNDYRYGAAVAVPTAVREGYTFKGWDKEVNLTAVATVDYTAQWEINQYTISFDTAGGTEIAPITQDYATDITAPDDPTKLGHEFAGWVDAEGNATTVPATMPANDVEITATWNVLAFDAIFDANTGAFEDETAQKTVTDITFGDAITAVADMPAKEGYTFKGWAATANATEALAPLGTMDAEGKTFYAVWDINEYTLTFDTDGGSEVAPITQDYATEITAPEAPTKDGYTFKGWAEKAGATEADAVELPATMPADSKTYYAIWDANEYTITFGNTGDTVIDPIVQDYDTAITAPDDPTKEGYEFAGWVDADGNPTEIPEKMPLDGAEINATWTPTSDREFKVVVHYTDIATGDKEAEFSYYDATTEQTIEIVEASAGAEDVYYVFLSDLAVAGYVLDENDKRNELTGVVAADNSTVLDLYYVATKVTATFNANGGKWAYGETEQKKELVYNDLVKNNLPANAPTREGYTFSSWQGVNDTLRLTGNRTFNAVWTANEYTITWYLDGETASEPVTYEYDALIVKNVAAEKEGHTFVEWVDENGKAITVPDKMPAENLTIVAKYDVNEYSITWNDGTTETTTPADYGDAIVAPAYEPTKEGYTFDGWETADGKTPEEVATVPVDGVEFIAQWTVNTYKLSYSVKNPATGAFDVVSTNNAVEYGSLISAVIPADDYTVPAGYVLSAAYTDANCTELLPANATMPAADKTLYYKLEAIDLSAVFNANGGKWEDGDTSKTVDTKYNEAIVAPADPALEGNTFAGWTPAVGTMDDVNGKNFVAQWTPNTYKAIFKAAPGAFADGETTETVDVVYGTAVTAPEEPTREGYTFKGWTDTVGGTTAVTLPTSMPAGDKTYYAIWEAKQITITFNTDGGTAVAPITKAYGAEVGTVAEPTKEGYTFKGWTPAVPATMPAKDLEVTAQWTVNNYTVIWNVDGEISTEYYDYGVKINKPEDPTKTGYTFAGWTPEVPETMPAANQTFTATWTPIEYDVTFVEEDGNTVVSGPTKVAYETAITAPADPVKDGYTFLGWFDVETGVRYSTASKMPARDVTYKAQWTTGSGTPYTVYVFEMDAEGNYPTEDAPTSTISTTGVTGEMATHNTSASTGFHVDENLSKLEGVILADGSLVLKVYYARDVYTIAFDTDNNGAFADSEKATYLHGSTVASPAAPSNSGYTFNGWNTKADGTGTGVASPATASAEYYATWIANYYTITFDSNDGTVVAPITAPYGSAITAPTKPTKEGYVFKGWSETEGGTTPATLPATMPVDGDTYYAIWEEAEYTVTYYTEKAMTDEQSHYTLAAKYLQEYNVPTDPVKEGHTFAGWYNAATNDDAGLPVAGGTVNVPLNGAKYYATWTVDEYELVYMPNNGTIDGSTANKTFKVPYGTAKADMPTVADPIREGWTFSGWNAELPETMPANRVNIQAQWTINQYDVVFDAGEGVFTLDDETTTSTITSEVDYAGYIEEPSAPARDGYEFIGWDAEIPAEMPAEDITFNAVWEALPDTAYKTEHYYMLADGTYAATADETVDGSGTTDTTATAVTKPVDNFTVDAEASILEGNIAGDGSLVLKVYYIRESNKFTIYDDVDAETPAAISEQDVLFDAPISVPADEDMKKTGYTFAGWVDAEGNPVTVPATMPGEALDIYASWTVNPYKITFNANTGAWADADVAKDVYVNYGDTISDKAPAEEPTKNGYEFKGWYDATADGYSINDPKYATMSDKELTFYAIWESQQRSYVIEIYEMSADGSMPETPTSIKLANAVVDEVVSVNDEDIIVAKGLRVDTEKSVLTGTVPADGTLTLKVYLVRDKYAFVVIDADGETLVSTEYLYDQTVEAVTSNVDEGYTFSHWSDTENGAEVDYPTRMPNNSVTLYAVWTINEHTATFDAGEGVFESTGKSTEVFKADYNEDIVAPTEIPTKLGYEFAGWTLDGTNKVEDFGKMGDADVVYTALWNRSSFTVSFYTYEPLTESPYKSEHPTKLVASATYKLGDKIVFPAETLDDIVYDGKTYYTFKGWSTSEDGIVLTASEIYNQAMPAADIAYYAVYERVKVQLIPENDDVTTVIDRAGLTVDDYDAETSRWYVYGLETHMTREGNELEGYVDVSGDGYYVIRQLGFEGSYAGRAPVGTGTIIDVYDNVTGELVESFWIIVYGDIDGDGRIDNTDAALVDTELAGLSGWSWAEDPDNYIHYKDKAARVTGGSRLQASDLAIIDNTSLGFLSLNQATGRVAQ